MKIQIENKQKLLKIEKQKLRGTVKLLLEHLDCRTKEVCVSLVDDVAIQQLNNLYLGKNKPTNVLSFSLQEGEYSGINPDILGDIVISVETAIRDSAKGGWTCLREIDFLIIHGLLHLLGYNHEKTTRHETIKMQKMEKILFEILRNR
jgi:probable rRNA maturation factor